jgi:iron complex outermembrane recepter protein
MGTRPGDVVRIYLLSTLMMISFVPLRAHSQITSDGGELGEIVVTAQKRSQSIESVGMSINAATGDTLLERGITDSSDLGKIVPGFVYTPSPTQTPVYSIRGIGFYDSTLASSPAVTVYVDEIPLAFPAMTTGAAMDLERVEVLKGPQGTLFGSNSTGGAINYIAAKPTSTFQAGGDLTYSRFGEVDIDSFVSGPISNTLNARVATRIEQGGDWQYSQTRPFDVLGKKNRFDGRILLDWQPSDRLKVAVNLNGFSNKSDSEAFQLVTRRIFMPALATPLLLNAPFPGENAREADWTADNPMRHDDTFGQASVRVDYQLSDQLTFTSLSSFSHLNVNTFDDTDGTASKNVDNEQFGSIKAYNQEFRLAGSSAQTHWITGATFDHSDNTDNVRVFIADNTLGQPLPFLPRIQSGVGRTVQEIDDYSVFGNLDYDLTDHWSASFGARATESDRHGNACTYDPTPGNAFGQQFMGLEQVATLLGAKTTPFVPIAPGQCFVLDSTFTPALNGVDEKLNQHNISGRAALNYKFDGGTLVYGSASRGFKAGAIPQIDASATKEYQPVSQERVDAFELGVKTPIGPMVHLNAAAFYYRYADKQFRGSVEDPIFGTLERLINVPRSLVRGLETDILVRPLTGLDLRAGISYVRATVLGSFVTYNREGIQSDFGGSTLPYTPKVTGNVDSQYEWSISNGIKPFVGASVVYKGADNSTFTNDVVPASEFGDRAYALLDLRAGFSSADGIWRVMLFGHNVTNKFYWTGVTQASDTFARSVGMPVTYGIMVSARTK